eukprot:TRINITY_DN294_c0_g2_i7.p1 TRINITY_DN294_c0_g2~~TRINITY_DN294_c0_g2_i7.p1  ORF type:complete len:217 (-),score=9.45 TRINITY_DN294_c0_g2_i7:197-847(-)
MDTTGLVLNAETARTLAGHLAAIQRILGTIPSADAPPNPQRPKVTSQTQVNRKTKRRAAQRRRSAQKNFLKPSSTPATQIGRLSTSAIFSSFPAFSWPWISKSERSLPTCYTLQFRVRYDFPVWVESDWQCARCQCSNFARRRKCFECQADIPIRVTAIPIYSIKTNPEVSRHKLADLVTLKSRKLFILPAQACPRSKEIRPVSASNKATDNCIVQ